MTQPFKANLWSGTRNTSKRTHGCNLQPSVLFFPFSRTLQTCHDDASKFVHLLAKPGCNYLEQDDFIPFLQVPAAALAGRGAGLGCVGQQNYTDSGVAFWRALWRWSFMWQKTKLRMCWRDVQQKGFTRRLNWAYFKSLNTDAVCKDVEMIIQSVWASTLAVLSFYTLIPPDKLFLAHTHTHTPDTFPCTQQ